MLALELAASSSVPTLMPALSLSLGICLKPLDKSFISFLKSARAETILVAAASLGTFMADDEVRFTLLIGCGLNESRLRENERTWSFSSPSLPPSSPLLSPFSLSGSSLTLKLSF